MAADEQSAMTINCFVIDLWQVKVTPYRKPMFLFMALDWLFSRSLSSNPTTRQRLTELSVQEPLLTIICRTPYGHNCRKGFHFHATFQYETGPY